MNTTITRLLLALPIICALSSGAYCQLDEVIKPLLKKIRGLSAWYSQGYQLRQIENQDKYTTEPLRRLGFSVKYGPLIFSEATIDTSYDTTTTFMRHMYDSCGKVKDCYIKDTVVIYKKETKKIHLHFGYQYGDQYRYQDENGFSIKTPLGGYFLETYYSQEIPKLPTLLEILTLGANNIGVGVGVSIYSFSGVSGSIKSKDSTNSLSLKMTTNTFIAPEATLFYSYNINGSKMKAFIDLSYQWLRPSGIKYETADGDRAYYASVKDNLPSSLNFDNVNIKIGFSLSSDILE